MPSSAAVAIPVIMAIPKSKPQEPSRSSGVVYVPPPPKKRHGDDTLQVGAMEMILLGVVAVVAVWMLVTFSERQSRA